MICPTCNVQMDHLNKGDGHTGTDSYQTYDYVRCPICFNTAIEFYHTQFLGIVRDSEVEGIVMPKPKMSIEELPSDESNRKYTDRF